jgi:RND superfamily putative drug exporter
VGAIAGVGRWCFRRRWWVLAAWFVAVVAGALAAGPVFSGLETDNNPRGLEAVQAYAQLGSGSETGGQVIALVDRVDTQTSGVRDTVTALAASVAARADVKEVGHPYGDPREARGTVATDGGALIVTVTLRAGTRAAEDAALDAVIDRLHELRPALRTSGQPDARVRIGGNRVLNRAANTQVQADLQRAEVISLPVTLVVLVIVFGGLIAAGLPVLAAAVSVAASLLVLLGFSYVTDLDQNTVTVVTLLGLGLSVDYGLLLVARYREELGRGFPPEEALVRAWATAGRTIMFSALTVAAALAGLLLFDISALAALGAAGVSIALVAMLAALTFTAAMIGFARHRIRPPKRRRQRHLAGADGRLIDSDDRGFFAGLSRFVQRWPWPVAVLTTAGLLAAGLPLLSATVKLPQLDALPRSIESVQVADALQARFGLRSAPTVLVVARVDAAALDTWAARWTGDPAVAEVRPAVAAGGGVASVELALRGGEQDDTAQALVKRIRADRPPGGRSWVAGDAAVLVDLLDVIVDGMPWAVTVTLLAMALLLFAMTGSVVVPVKAILANVVSLGATFGVLVAVFEHGFGSSVLATLTVGGLSPFIVIIVFAFAFGLSMDYEVFLLGRIKEYVEAGADSDTAVRRGLQHTGRIITSAALLMIIVFACFASAEMGAIEEVGLGLTVAVLIDATVVRCLLVPATMTLLGRWNWWAPDILKRLHERVGLREAVLPDAAPAWAGPAGAGPAWAGPAGASPAQAGPAGRDSAGPEAQGGDPVGPAATDGDAGSEVEAARPGPDTSTGSAADADAEVEAAGPGPDTSAGPGADTSAPEAAGKR